MARADLVRPPREVPELDSVAREVLRRRRPYTETEVLGGLWAAGEEARLDEDVRFVQVAPGRWVHRDHLRADELLEAALRAGWDGRDWEVRLERLDHERGGRHLLVLEDSPLRLEEDGRLCLRRLLLHLREEPMEGEECLPLHSLESAGRWLGRGEPPEPRGYLLLEPPAPAPPDAFLLEVVDRGLEPRLREGALVLLVPGCGEGLHLLAREESFSLGPPAAGVLPLARVLREIAPGEVLEFDLPGGRVRAAATEADLDRRLERLARRRVRDTELSQPVSEGPAMGWRARPELALSGDAQRLYVLFPPRRFEGEVEAIEIEGRSRPAEAFSRAVLFEVPPHDGIYRARAWRGGGCEPRPELSCAGLEPEAATVFPVPVGGLARRTAGPLTPGRTYRLVTPSARRGTARRLVLKGHAARLGALGAFDVLELQVPRDEHPDLDRLLQRLGLSRATAGLQLEVGSGLPDRLQDSATGEALPVYSGGVPLRLRVRAPRELPEGEASLLVVGPAAALRLPLPTGEEWEAELRDAAPGLWLAETRSRTGDLEPALARFYLEHPLQETRPTAAAWVLSWDGADLQPGEDLPPADLGPAVPRLSLQLPPLWPLEVTFRLPAGPGEVQRLRADGEGRIDVASLRGRMRTFLRQHPVACVEFSAGELGTVVLLHQGAQDEAALVERLRRCPEAVDLEMLEFDTLEDRLSTWIVPVLEIVGLQPAGPVGVEGFPVAAVAWQDRTPVLEPFAWLQPVEVLGDAASDPGLRAALERARSDGLHLAIATDGVNWVIQRTHTRLRLSPAVHDLREALAEPEPRRLLDFLRDLGG